MGTHIRFEDDGYINPLLNFVKRFPYLSGYGRALRMCMGAKYLPVDTFFLPFVWVQEAEKVLPYCNFQWDERKKKNTFALKTDLTTWVCGGFSPFLSMDWRLETIFTFIQEKDKHKHLQISSSSTNSACWCKILYYDFIYFRSRCDGIWVVVAESGIKALTSSSPYEILKKKRQHLQT